MRARAVFVFAALLGACASTSRERDLFRAQTTLARELIAVRDFAGALTVVERLRRDAPDKAEPLVLRASIYRDQGLYDDAQTDLEDALKRRPDDAEAHAGLGVLYDLQGKSERAEPHHRHALDAHPDNARYLNNYAHSLFIRGKAADAVPLYRKAVSLDPDNARMRNNLGFAYALSGDMTRAAQQFAVGARPAEARNNLGYAYELRGNLPQAFECYVEALRLEPSLQRARQNAIHVGKKLGRELPAELAHDPGSGKEQVR